MRGSIELSLNALIMFILSVMVLGAGIYLVNFVLQVGFETIQFDECTDAKMAQLLGPTDKFVLCPSVISASDFGPRKEFVIRYAFYNVADTTNTEYAVSVDDPDGDYETQPSMLSDVRPREPRNGIMLIRAVDVPSLSDTEYVKVFICPDEDQADPEGRPKCDLNTNIYGPDNTDPEIFRTLTINVR